METYSWIKQENTEQGEPGSYEAHTYYYYITLLLFLL